MTFLEYINGLLRKEIAKAKNLAIFGQNIAAGSYLGGLTKGLKVGAGSRIINSTNAENSLVGLGFGAGAGTTGAAIVTTDDPCAPLIVFLLCASYASDCGEAAMVAVPLSLARKVMVPRDFVMVNPPGNPAVFVTLPAVMLS